MCIFRATNTADELVQFLDTLKPTNSVPVNNETHKKAFNNILVHIKSEPEIDILPDDTEDDFGELSRSISAEPKTCVYAFSDEDQAASEEPNTVCEGSITDSQNSTDEDSITNDSSVEPIDIDVVFEHLNANVKPFQVCRTTLSPAGMF